MNAEVIKNNVTGRRPCNRIPITCAADVQWYGQMAAQTQIFGSINPAEGAMIIGICHQVGISWLEFAETFNMMHHRISKKTDAILASLLEYGGQYEIISRTDEKAEAKFKYGKAAYTSSLVWEDCLSEPFIYQGKEEVIVNNITSGNTAALVMKPKYRTKRSRMQMIWARCVSDGVRAVCPQACQGVYTPEEVEDFVENEYPSIPVAVVPQAAPAVVPVAAPAAPAQEVAAPVANIEICNAGTMAGKRWDSMDNNTLTYALNASFPEEVKAYIREILSVRAATAATSTSGQSTTQSETTQN